jgi:hypothetical protein
MARRRSAATRQQLDHRDHRLALVAAGIVTLARERPPRQSAMHCGSARKSPSVGSAPPFCAVDGNPRRSVAARPVPRQQRTSAPRHAGEGCAAFADPRTFGGGHDAARLLGAIHLRHLDRRRADVENSQNIRFERTHDRNDSGAARRPQHVLGRLDTGGTVLVVDDDKIEPSMPARQAPGCRRTYRAAGELCNSFGSRYR